MDRHLAFLVSQAAHIEPEVYRRKYAQIQYSQVVPVVTAANEYADSIMHFSMDGVGEAKLLAERGTDVPIVETTKQRHVVAVQDAGIGYDYSYVELGQAMLTGTNLTSDRAMVARRVGEELLDDICMNGRAALGWDGLLNNTAPARTDAPSNAAANSTDWVKKSGDEVIKDVNGILGGVWVDSEQVEYADTLLLPPSVYNHIANTARSTYSDMSILEWIMKHNITTSRTGQQILIRELRGLEDAAAGNRGRAMAYRRDPEVLRFHLPMPLRFLDPERRGFRYVVPGIFRTAGLEIRLPGAVRYLDLISPAV